MKRASYSTKTFAALPALVLCGALATTPVAAAGFGGGGMGGGFGGGHMGAGFGAPHIGAGIGAPHIGGGIGVPHMGGGFAGPRLGAGFTGPRTFGVTRFGGGFGTPGVVGLPTGRSVAFAHQGGFHQGGFHGFHHRGAFHNGFRHHNRFLFGAPFVTGLGYPYWDYPYNADYVAADYPYSEDLSCVLRRSWRGGYPRWVRVCYYY